jgi:hypothetical protein
MIYRMKRLAFLALCGGLLFALFSEPRRSAALTREILGFMSSALSAAVEFFTAVLGG